MRRSDRLLSIAVLVIGCGSDGNVLRTRDGGPATADACSSAECDLCTCTDPPASECVGPNTLRVYGADGFCADGSCTYAPTDQDCPEGCDAGACLPCVPTDWSAPYIIDDEIVGQPSTYFYYPAVAVDASGGLHVVYRADGAGPGADVGTLRYAHRAAAGTWTTSQIGEIPEVALLVDSSDMASVTIDSAGEPHVAFYAHNSRGPELSHAYRNRSLEWVTEVIVGPADVVERTGAYGLIPVLRTGASGELIAIYRHITLEPEPGALSSWMGVSRRGDDGTWTTTTQDTQLGAFAAETDGSGVVHVVFDGQGPSIRYGHLATNGTWEVSDLLGDDQADGPSMALDPTGSLHVIYRDRERDETRYVRRTASGEWTSSETLPIFVGDPPVAIAVDSDGGVHASYGSHYVHRSPDGEWTLQDVDPTSPRGGWGLTVRSAIAVDARGGLHLVYPVETTTETMLEGATSELRYAYRQLCR